MVLSQKEQVLIGIGDPTKLTAKQRQEVEKQIGRSDIEAWLISASAQELEANALKLSGPKATRVAPRFLKAIRAETAKLNGDLADAAAVLSALPEKKGLGPGCGASIKKLRSELVNRAQLVPKPLTTAFLKKQGLLAKTLSLKGLGAAALVGGGGLYAGRKLWQRGKRVNPGNLVSDTFGAQRAKFDEQFPQKTVERVQSAAPLFDRRSVAEERAAQAQSLNGPDIDLATGLPREDFGRRRRFGIFAQRRAERDEAQWRAEMDEFLKRVAEGEEASQEYAELLRRKAAAES